MGTTARVAEDYQEAARGGGRRTPSWSGKAQMPWGLIALVAFWVVAIRLWMVDGPKVPLVFMAIWAAGYFGLPALGVGGYFVVAFQAVLAAILLIVERYKEAA